MLAGLLLFGTTGYVVIEGWHWFDAFYMTVITLATIGFGETHPLSTAGRAFTIVLIFVGAGVVYHALSAAGRFVFENWFGELAWRSRMNRELSKLEGHYVLCGCGRVGRLVREELAAAGSELVVIERDPQVAARLAAQGILVIEGDATDEDTLRRARIQEAAGLVAALPEDADNVYITMAAREMNPTLPIVARAGDEAAVARLRKVGATRVVSPNAIGGREMAHALLTPDVVEFLEIATAGEQLELRLQQVRVGVASKLARQGAQVGQMRSLFEVSVVAMRRREGDMFDMPASETAIQGGDTLIVVGRGADCQRLSALALEDHA